MCTHVHTCIYGGQRLAPRILGYPLPSFFAAGPLTEPEPHCFGQTDQRTQQSLLPIFSRLR